MSSEMVGVTSWTQDFCDKVQFDFSDPQKAFNQFQGCRGLGSPKNEQDLLQRFTSGWAQFAAHNGVGTALRALVDPNVRGVLLPPEDWGSLITHITGGNSIVTKISSNMKTLITLQVVTIIFVILSLIVVSMIVWRQRSYINTCSPVRRRSKECLLGEDIGLLNEQEQINRGGMNYKNQLDNSNQ